jgi:hypothetical protein
MQVERPAREPAHPRDPTPMPRPAHRSTCEHPLRGRERGSVGPMAKAARGALRAARGRVNCAAFPCPCTVHPSSPVSQQTHAAAGAGRRACAARRRRAAAWVRPRCRGPLGAHARRSFPRRCGRPWANGPASRRPPHCYGSPGVNATSRTPVTPLAAMPGGGEEVLAAAARLLEDESLHDITFFCGRDGGARRRAEAGPSGGAARAGPRHARARPARCEARRRCRPVACLAVQARPGTLHACAWRSRSRGRPQGGGGGALAAAPAGRGAASPRLLGARARLQPPAAGRRAPAPARRPLAGVVTSNKAYLAARCEYFRLLFSASWKEGEPQAAGVRRGAPGSGAAAGARHAWPRAGAAHAQPAPGPTPALPQAAAAR